MDSTRFDRLVRSLGTVTDRRAILTVLASGSAVAVGLATPRGGAARRRCKKRCGTRCIPQSETCCAATTGLSCAAGQVCCPPTLTPELPRCAGAGQFCCLATQGGGFCDVGETCCGPSAAYPAGSCAPGIGSVCCRSGYCSAGQTCCPPTPVDPNSAQCNTPGQTYCCAASAAGGFCDVGWRCCAPSPGWPNGSCVPNSQSCTARSAGGEIRVAKGGSSGRGGTHRERHPDAAPRGHAATRHRPRDRNTAPR